MQQLILETGFASLLNPIRSTYFKVHLKLQTFSVFAKSLCGISCILVLTSVADARLPDKATLQRCQVVFSEILKRNGHPADTPSMTCPLTQKLARWIVYRQEKHDAPFIDIIRFLHTTKGWPYRLTIQKNAEKNLSETFHDLSEVKEIVAWFDQNPPRTFHGLKIYAKFLKAKGQNSHQAVRRFWIEKDFNPEEHKAFLDHFGKQLDSSDHLARFNHLLWKGDPVQIKGVSSYIPSDNRAFAQAYLALLNGQTDAIRKIPEDMKNDPHLFYQRLRYLRRKDRFKQAIALWETLPNKIHKKKPAVFARERQILTRDLIREKKYRQAFRLIQAHRSPNGIQHAEAEWLAAWLYLRHLNQAEQAFQRFSKAYAKVTTPISRARFAFWAGLASEKAGHSSKAQQWWGKAASHWGTFYGQLACLKIGKALPSLGTLSAKVQNISKAKKNQFDQQTFVKITHLLNAYDRPGEEMIPFFHKLFLKADTIQLINLAKTVQQNYLAVEAAKQIGLKQTSLLEEAFPLIPLPKNLTMDPALIHAIIRQESRFHENAVSSANARGLMQLRPRTALERAKLDGLTHDSLFNPLHNVRVGSSYFHHLYTKYSSGLVLSITAYNAGMGRVETWLKAYGDPRASGVRVIDWIEMIPYGETRSYVHRVLENYTIYKHRVGGETPKIMTLLHRLT